MNADEFTVVLSPHLDDAALSCGQLIAALDEVVVATVFAGIPQSDVPLTKYDVDSGFTSAREAVTKRREEDETSCFVLHAQSAHYDFLDHQYGIPSTVEEIAHAIEDLVVDADVLVAPLGLAHPDHASVASAVRYLARQVDMEVLFYEEQPARVLWPDAVQTVFRDVAAEGWELYYQEHDIPAGPLRKKANAIACYGSQLWALDEHACLVPERYWKGVPPALRTPPPDETEETQ